MAIPAAPSLFSLFLFIDLVRFRNCSLLNCTFSFRFIFKALRVVLAVTTGLPSSKTSRINSFSCKCEFMPLPMNSRRVSYCLRRSQLSKYKLSVPNLIKTVSNSPCSIVFKMSRNDERCCFLSFLLRYFAGSLAKFFKSSIRVSSSKQLKSLN